MARAAEEDVDRLTLRPGRIELAQLKRTLLDPEDRVAWQHIDRIAFDRGLVGFDRHWHVRVAPEDFVEKALPRGIKVGHYHESHSRARRDILEQAAKRFDSACGSADAYYRETIGLRHVLGQRAVRPTPPTRRQFRPRSFAPERPDPRVDSQAFRTCQGRSLGRQLLGGPNVRQLTTLGEAAPASARLSRQCFESLDYSRRLLKQLCGPNKPFPRASNLRGDLIGKDLVAAGLGLGINEGASNGNRVGPSPTAFQDFNKGQDGKHGSGGVSDLESTSPWVPPLRNEEAFAFPYEDARHKPRP